MPTIRSTPGSSEPVLEPLDLTPATAAPAPAREETLEVPVIAVGAGDLPAKEAKGNARPVGIAGLTVAQGLKDTQKPGNLTLIEGRFPDAVGLPVILSQLAGSTGGAAAVEQLLGDFTAHTGLAVSPSLKNAVLAKPQRLADVLVATPKQLSSGIDLLNVAQKAGKLKPLPPKARALPKTFDAAKLEKLDVKRPEYTLKELAPGLYQGDVKSDLPDDQARRNIVTAEIFDRLADNAYDPPGKRFTIQYAGHGFTRLDNFLKALVADGHTIEARMEHRVANFANLKTKAPDGTVLDVPAALMVRTGISGAAGEEALVPTVHSELVFSIRKSASTKGPGIDADVKWYQGISGTGFFPVDLAKTPAWCGKTVSDTFSGAEALEAAVLAGLLGDVINTSAAAQQLAVGGYGATGVCNDSVAIVQHALSGAATPYPLLMRDAMLATELQQRLADADQKDDPRYAKLAASIAAVPSDDVPNPTARARALASLPWTEGQEPFESITRARQILAG